LPLAIVWKIPRADDDDGAQLDWQSPQHGVQTSQHKKSKGTRRRETLSKRLTDVQKSENLIPFMQKN